MVISKDLIKSAKESLGIRSAEVISSGLRLNKWDNRNLKGCCPFHKEETPSFIWNKKGNQFKCFGCGKTLDIFDYYIKFSGMTFLEAVKELFYETNIVYDFDTLNYTEQRENNSGKPYVYPCEEKNIARDKVESYMNLRKISKATLDSRGVKQDINGNVVFEFRDENNILLMVKYRPSRQLGKEETKTWCQKGKDTVPILIGMNMIDTTKPLLICEGEIDALSAIEAGFTNAVSVPFGAGNYQWIDYNWDWLNELEKIIIWSDNDAAGEKMRNEVVPRLGEYRCYVVRSNYKDINEQLCNEGALSVIRSIEAAREIPIKDIIDLADVDEYDINKVEKIKSGYNGLDKYIGGFVLGTLNVITGINSSGKSTLVNQMCICEPLEQGHNVFIYSNELQQTQLRSWIEFPLAGSKNIIEYNNGSNQPIGYAISNDVKEQMRKWYRGRIQVYCNEEDTCAKSLLQKMKELTMRYGTKVFIIDNLMMVDLQDGEGDILKKQKEFVLELKKFARRYNSVVHLIAHPRKTQTIQRLTKLDVAGTGDITNLADYVLSIHRIQPSEKEECPYDNIIDLFKNRPYGHQDKTIGLHFDIKSKRFYGDSDDLYKQYSWYKTSSVLRF